MRKEFRVYTGTHKRNPALSVLFSCRNVLSVSLNKVHADVSSRSDAVTAQGDLTRGGVSRRRGRGGGGGGQAHAGN